MCIWVCNTAWTICCYFLHDLYNLLSLCTGMKDNGTCCTIRHSILIKFPLLLRVLKMLSKQYVLRSFFFFFSLTDVYNWKLTLMISFRMAICVTGLNHTMGNYGITYFFGSIEWLPKIYLRLCLFQRNKFSVEKNFRENCLFSAIGCNSKKY